MTFEVYLDNQLLFYPNDESCVITEAVVESSLNEAGTFQCNIPKNNPLYEGLENKVRSSMIQVKQNGTEIFYGEIREVKQNFNMTKQVYAVGELAFLFDSIQPQAKYQTSPYTMLKSLIDKHNSQVEAKKKFNIGYVTVKDSNDYIYRFTNYEDTLTAIRDKLCDTLNGFLRVRKVNGTRYLDLVKLEDYGSYCKQEIQFGENLLDYSCNTTASEIATAVIPLGAKLDDEKRTKEAVDGLDEYTTIKGTEVYQVNGKNQTYSYDKDYVFNQTAVNQFGWIKVVKHWDDVTTKRALKAKAEEWIKSVQFAKMELNINAFDGNLLDINVDAFEVGDTVHAWALPYGMDTTFPVRKKTTYINDVSKNLITLGTTASTSYTSQASKALNVVEEQLPEESEILRNAKQNALSMLTDPTKGYVTYIFDENGNRTEIWIADTQNQSTMTKKWVWNSSGLGYLYKKNGEWKTDIAMTMDGAIVADRITTGMMLADRIKGGTLELGGTGYAKNGIIQVKNDSGTDIVKIDKTGITMQNGTQIAWSAVNHPNDLATTGQISPLYQGVQTIYYLSSNGSQPNKPTTKVTSDSKNSNTWTTALPTWIASNTNAKYYQCVQYTTQDNKISWSNVFEYSDSDVSTQITKNTVTTSYVNALKVIAKDVEANSITSNMIKSDAVTAEKINVNTLSAISANMGTVNVGGSNNTNGSISVKSASGAEIVKLDQNGLTLGKNQMISWSNVDDKENVVEQSMLSGSGKTKINGDNITTGMIQSQLAAGGDDGTFTWAGIKLDLDDGWMSAPNFAIDSGGNAYFRGAIQADSGTFSGELKSANGTFEGTVSAGKVQSTSYSDGTGGFSNNGIQIDLANNGSMKAKNFYIDSNGNAKFKGDITGANGTFSGTLSGNSGSIGGFNIDSNQLSIEDSRLSADVIGCGKAGKGIVNLVGDSDDSTSKYGYIQISNSGNPNQCLDGIRIYGNGLIRRYDGSGTVTYEKWLSNI